MSGVRPEEKKALFSSGASVRKLKDIVPGFAPGSAGGGEELGVAASL